METWKVERLSIWQAGMHDNPFGRRLKAFMSLLADHPDVHFHYYRKGLGSVEAEMH